MKINKQQRLKAFCLNNTLVLAMEYQYFIIKHIIYVCEE